MMRSFGWPLAVFVALALGAVALGQVPHDWSNWKPASCMPEACFCEAIRPGTVAQPSNTWSSLGFVLAGMLVIGTYRRDRLAGVPAPARSRMAGSPVYPGMYGIALVFIGLGSTFYHASMTFAGQFCDLMGMYLLGSFILLYNFSRFTAFRPRVFALAYPALNLALAAGLLFFPYWRRVVFAVLLLAALVPEFRGRRTSAATFSRRYLFAALATLVVAFIIWVLDYLRIWCDPFSWLQGHALWHLLGAAAGVLLYLHYRGGDDALRAG